MLVILVDIYDIRSNCTCLTFAMKTVSQWTCTACSRTMDLNSKDGHLISKGHARVLGVDNQLRPCRTCGAADSCTHLYPGGDLKHYGQKRLWICTQCGLTEVPMDFREWWQHLQGKLHMVGETKLQSTSSFSVPKSLLQEPLKIPETRTAERKRLPIFKPPSQNPGKQKPVTVGKETSEVRSHSGISQPDKKPYEPAPKVRYQFHTTASLAPLPTPEKVCSYSLSSPP